MLVLENDGEYRRWKIERRNANRVTRDRKSRQVVQEKLAQLRRGNAEGFEVDRAKKLVSTTSSTADQPASAERAPATSSPASNSPTSQPSRGVDLDFATTHGGGGAIEPLTALISLGTIGAAAMARRRRRRLDAE